MTKLTRLAMNDIMPTIKKSFLELPVDIRYNDESHSPMHFFTLLENQQVALLCWCLSLRKTKTFTSVSSLDLKKVYEQGIGHHFVSSGMMKGAMILTGFKVKDETEVYWIFNVHQQSLNKYK